MIRHRDYSQPKSFTCFVLGPSDGMLSWLRRSSSATRASSGTSLIDPRDHLNVYSMMRKSKKKAQIRKDGISRASMNARGYRVVTEVCISGYGSIPVVKGDPKILPVKAQLFIAEKAKLMRPRAIYICDGSPLERMDLMKKMTDAGLARQLEALTGCYLVSTDPRDATAACCRPVVSTENKNCCKTRHLEGDVNFAKWMSPFVLSLELDEHFPAAMIGRVMYVVPFSLGSIGAVNSLSCVQLTDSAYVALMTTICATSVWDSMEDKQFVRCIHSVGVRRPALSKFTNNWPCAPELRFLALRPENREIWSYGTGSESAVLCKSEVALRLASIIAKHEGWLAERMAIICVTDPDKMEHFIGVAGPDECSKVCLTLLQPTIPGWKIEVLGDEVAWIRTGEDGGLYACNPLNGFFLHVSGFNPMKGSVGKEFLSKNALFTNVGHTSQGQPCWSSCDIKVGPGDVIYDWCGQPWNNSTESMIEHLQASVAIRYDNFPKMHSQWGSNKGFPLKAIIFCTRRRIGVPLVFEAFTWQNGIFSAATMRTESPNSPKEAEPTLDPMGMARFIGYSFGDYIRHWLSFDKPTNKLPRLFFVNLFQKQSNNQYLWPGFGDNMRILVWIIRRVTSTPEDGIVKSNVGLIPKKDSMNLKGLDVKWDELMATPKAFWIDEMKALRKIFDTILGADIPKAIIDEFVDFEKRLSSA